MSSIAVVGATGAVGALVRRLLHEREFPFSSIRFLASKRSVGDEIDFGGEVHKVELLEPDVFKDIDLAIASTPDEVAAEFVPWAKQHGTVVIDESGYHRMLDDVPLVIPEVNPEAVDQHQGVIASPNCSTTQMVMALKPLHDAAKLTRVIVSTYQATSGAGLAGVKELIDGSRAALDGEEFSHSAFAHPIAFNLIPQIGSIRDEGYTSEEIKMVRETHKILQDPSIKISATCVRVPVTDCHSETITVETEKPLSPDQARELLGNAPGMKVIDDIDTGRFPMPNECAGDDRVFVGRIRRDTSSEHGLTFWCVSDNLRKGAATNAVQIAELMVGHNAPSCATSN